MISQNGLPTHCHFHLAVPVKLQQTADEELHALLVCPTTLGLVAKKLRRSPTESASERVFVAEVLYAPHNSANDGPQRPTKVKNGPRRSLVSLRRSQLRHLEGNRRKEGRTDYSDFQTNEHVSKP